MTLSLYLIFIYYFAIVAFYFLPKAPSDNEEDLKIDPYYGLCNNLYTCFSVIFDNTHKGKIKKMFASYKSN